jgi:methionine synthase II (cobalamin-independent)
MVNLTINNIPVTLRCLINVQDLNVESAEVILRRIRKHNWLAPEQTLITSSCGLNHLPRHIAFGKLQAMVEAKTILAAIYLFFRCHPQFS